MAYGGNFCQGGSRPDREVVRSSRAGSIPLLLPSNRPGEERCRHFMGRGSTRVCGTCATPAAHC
jgi:hypothetical protein